LEKIAHYLKIFPEMTVEELAGMSGFSSSSTFIRAFRTYYGITPEMFRNKNSDEISKIGTSKPQKGTFREQDTADLWNVQLILEETKGWKDQAEIEVMNQRSLKLVFMDTHLGHTDAIQQVFSILANRVKAYDLLMPESQFIGIFLDMPFYAAWGKCRYRACISIGENTVPKETGLTAFPAGKYASYLHKGTLQQSPMKAFQGRS
jgi:AraC family transcriptional regulator